MRKVDWDLLVQKKELLTSFANGSLSGTELYSMTAGTNFGGEVRNLIRPGVDRARTIARKALKRRGLV